MAIFKLAVRYEGISAEEFVDIEADRVSEARTACDRVMEENKKLLERLEASGIYASKRMISCRLCPYDYRMEFLGCYFEESKDEL